MRLLVISNYQNKSTQYREGVVIEVSEADGRFLLVDAPGCFAIENPPPILSIDTPPVDRMIRKRHVRTK